MAVQIVDITARRHAMAGATVTICHLIPALALIPAWVLLVWKVWGVFRTDSMLSGAAID
jgi:hypothetical protein